jgi:hypothetical protein
LGGSILAKDKSDLPTQIFSIISHLCSFGEDFRPLADFIPGSKHPMQDKGQKHTIEILVRNRGMAPGSEAAQSVGHTRLPVSESKKNTLMKEHVYGHEICL